MDRVQRRKQKERHHEDRDKTLEPNDDRKSFNSLAKSATSAVIPQKERTPFALKSKRANKYEAFDIDLHHTPVTKQRDEINKYHDYFSSPYNSSNGLSSATNGHNYTNKYEEKENAHGSKKYGSSKTSRTRPLQAYSRNDSGGGHKNTAINLFELKESTNASPRKHRNYAERKSNNNQKSKTEQFFESEDAFSPLPEVTEVSERERRRQEIQDLMMKYSQIDNFYSNKMKAPTTSNAATTTKNRSSPKSDENNNNDTSHHYIDPLAHYHVKSPDNYYKNGGGGAVQNNNHHQHQNQHNKVMKVLPVKSPSNHLLQNAIVPFAMPGETAYHHNSNSNNYNNHHFHHRQREIKPRHHQPTLSTFVRQTKKLLNILTKYLLFKSAMCVSFFAFCCV